MKRLTKSGGGFGLWKIALTAIVTVLFFAAFTAIGSAATIYVPDDYGTIQGAVDAAGPGDTIIVRDGTYTENVNVLKSLTIRSENGSASTTVQASNSNDHVFAVTVDYVNISGFTATGATTGSLNAGILFYHADYCKISENNCSNNNEGIWLIESSNNNLSGNTADSNYYIGILLSSSSNNNNLNGNTVNSNNYDGVRLSSSSNNNLTGNTVNSNNEYGIFLLDSSNNNELTSNIANSNKDYGIHLYSSSNNRIYNNYFNNTNNAADNGNNIWYITKKAGTNIIGGPYLGGNYWSDYAGMDTDGDGLGDTLLPYNSSGEIQNGGDYHPLVFVFNCTCGDICVNETGWWQDGGAFIASGTPIQDAIDNAITGETICVKDGTYHENVNVNKSLTIRSENGSASTTVQASNSNDHVFEITADYVNISGFTATGATGSGKVGIYLNSVQHCNISGNNCSNNHLGIFLRASSNNNLTGNTASNNGVGIYLSPSSNNNTLTSNTASNNFNGIGLSYSSNNNLTGNNASNNNFNGIWLSYSSNNNLTGNTANSNNNHGIVLEKSSSNNLTGNNASNNGEGIRLEKSSSNNLTGNTVNSNYNYGIFLWSWSYNNKLTSNTASNNGGGIYLYSLSNNRIYNNYFNNTNNAWDDGNNIWNITKEAGTNIIGGPYLGGNYWSDYRGKDLDGDGLGDTLLPYNSSGNIQIGGDWHPLTTVGYVPPEIISFAPPSPVNDTVCNWRTFNVTVDQTVNVSWYLNNTLQHTNVSTKEANYSLHAEVVGEHNVTAIASNANGSDMQSWVWNVTKAVGNPDLVITGKWLCWPDNCTICYNVTNIGNGTAPACHSTALYVDGVAVAYDHVPVDLAPGESYTGCFADYTWTYTSPSDNITVCADNNETLDELDESNNCLTNIWMCGDVNCDGKVTMSDVRKVFNRYLDPNYPLDLPWAADVNGDGKVTMSDVRKVFNRYLDLGYELDCCCESGEVR